jgi:plasmid stabilization system protein ParE
MNSRFIDACLAEIDEAVTWYAEQSPELPERVLAELQSAVEKLIPFPEAFHMVSAPYRRVRLSKFPYALFFRVDPAEIVIVGFFHQHSDPARWKELLKAR